STSTLDLASVLLWVIVQSFHIVGPVLRAPSGPDHQAHVTFAGLRGITWRLRTRYAPQATLPSSLPYLIHRSQRRPWTSPSQPQTGLSLGTIFAIHRVGRTPTASISGRGIRAAPVPVFVATETYAAHLDRIALQVLLDGSAGYVTFC